MDRVPDRSHRKTLQLCAQAARAIELALAELSADDDALDGVHVVSVDPVPGDPRLLVTVGLSTISKETAPARVHASLVRHTPRLRAEVAEAISRKKVPDFFLRIAAPGAPAVNP